MPLAYPAAPCAGLPVALPGAPAVQVQQHMEENLELRKKLKVGPTTLLNARQGSTGRLVYAVVSLYSTGQWCSNAAVLGGPAQNLHGLLLVCEQQQQHHQEEVHRAAIAAESEAGAAAAAQQHQHPPAQAGWEEELEEATRLHNEEVARFQQALERSEKELLEVQLELRRARGEVGRARDALAAAELEKQSLQQELAVQQSLLEAANRDLVDAAARLRQREQSLTEVTFTALQGPARSRTTLHPLLPEVACAPREALVCPSSLG